MEQDGARSSWAESSVAYSSKRSTQASFASSRTSYCSNLSHVSSGYSGLHQSHPGILHTAPEASYATSSYAEVPQGTVSAGQSITNRLTKPAPETIQARCPWCGTTFTRRHDFKKHAREFHLSRVFWQCGNPRCRERTGSERQTKMHPNRTRSVDCKNLGSAKFVLQRDRKHFGCPHCARYFDDAEAYLAHLALECCPSKAKRSPHQSLQIRALLQQPGLVSHVKNYCSELRGDPEAYTQLWWTWDKSTMADIIERLEYGVHRHIDSQHPGLGLTMLDSFLQDLLAPSPKSILEAEIRHHYTTKVSSTSEQKPLPPLPNDEEPPHTYAQYHYDSTFEQTRSYLQPESEQHSHSGPQPYPSTVEEWRLQQPHHDPMIAGSFPDWQPQVEDFDFEWHHLAEDINVDPRQSTGFNYGRFG